MLTYFTYRGLRVHKIKLAKKVNVRVYHHQYCIAIDVQSSMSLLLCISFGIRFEPILVISYYFRFHARTDKFYSEAFCLPQHQHTIKSTDIFLIPIKHIDVVPN